MKYETLSSFIRSLTPETEVKMKARLVKSVGQVQTNKPIIVRRRGDKK